MVTFDKPNDVIAAKLMRTTSFCLEFSFNVHVFKCATKDMLIRINNSTIIKYNYNDSLYFNF